MSTSKELILSQKYNNYDYAPGIATYGIDGKTGLTGEDGNNIYFTDYDIIDSTSDLNEMLSKIMSNILPLVGLNIKTTRPYKVRDLFFDKTGRILELINISYSSGNTNNYTSYFKIVGKLNAKLSSDFFRFITNNRLALNATYDKGFDILSGINTDDPTTYESYIDKNAALNIVSNVINENDNIDMIRMQCIDNVDIEDGQLTLAYKTTDNAFYVDSNKPVVINGDLKVNADNNVDKEYDNFSTVLTSDDTVTYFKYLCDKLKYSVIYDDLANLYILSIYQSDKGSDALTYLANRKDTVFGKIYTGNNDQILMKLSDVIDGKISAYTYDAYLPAYNILDLPASITKSDFNIQDINVENSSIYVDCTENLYNKSISIDVSIKASIKPQILANGFADAYNSLSSETGLSTAYGPYTGIILSEPHGLEFSEPMNIQDRKCYVEITPIDKIQAGDILNVSVYAVDTNTQQLYAQIWVDGVLQDTNKIDTYEISDEADTTKHIYSLTYTFDVDVNRPIYIGFPYENYRLHKYAIVKKSNVLNTISPEYYEQTIMNNVFGVKLSYIKNYNTYEINSAGYIELDTTKTAENSFIYNENGRYKFTFDTKDIKKIDNKQYIYLDIIPIMDYNGGVPVLIKFIIPDDLNGSYTLYFTILHSILSFSVLNIMLDNENGVKNYNSESIPCILSYIPNSVDSVKRFSLMHNTEIFIDYWNEIPKDENYNTQGKIDSAYDSYIYRLTGYDPYIYNATRELVPLDREYYQYSGQITRFDNLLCYVWDRYEWCGKSSDLDYECKILTNTLDLNLPLTTSSPEFVAILNGYDTDYRYDNEMSVVYETKRTEDYEGNPFTNIIPVLYQGLCVLKKIKK